ncbi:50S ribosomal protein L19, partial [Leuconostoc mesenteroides]
MVKGEAKIVEGSRESVQGGEGVGRKRKGDGIKETYTVSKIASG